MRKSGILLPVFSLPDKYGRGCFSEEAYNFIDKLSVAGQKYWQILPITSQGKGNSPYSPISCFAGEPSYIDPDSLIKKGILSQEELDACFDDHGQAGTASPGETSKRGSLNRERMLRKAYYNSMHGATPFFTEYESSFTGYCRKNSDWLDDYAIYKTLSNHYDGRHWVKWPDPIKMRKPEALDEVREKLSDEIEFHKWVQFEFDDQWQDLRRYAHDRDVDIIGDIPIYASYESADCWANPSYFKLDDNLSPITVSGCPPDDYALDGQVWETPIYNWGNIKKSGYKWWIARLKRMFELYDVVRLDHARGFESFFEIPAETMKARDGFWTKGPGLDFFRSIMNALGDVRFIAEDLGYITPEVDAMIAATGIPNMKVVQLGFDTDAGNPYIPENVTENSVIYTGTHDNDTTVGWYDIIIPGTRANVDKYAIFHLGEKVFNQAKEPGKLVADLLVRLAMASKSETCIIPIQDYLLLGSEARINVPGVPDGNWRWQLSPGAFDDTVVKKIRDLTIATNRI